MKGSKKQIEWAEDIRATMQPGFDSIRAQFEGNAIAIKAIDYVQSLDHAGFWIDNRSSNPMIMLTEIARGRLYVRSAGSSHTAKFDQTTGKITVAWNEIISDGKGGHREIKEEVT